jgi:cation diffusion facilitator family transporter
VTHLAPAYELPPDKAALQRRAVRLEWLSIAYFFTAVVVVYLALGSSQAMKAAWIEDLLGFLPPIAFLVAAHVRRREPDERFPWGYHRAVGIGYLAASIALLVLGTYIFLESALKLVTRERPPIGAIELFGQTIWQGWVMLAALVWTGVPNVILGRLKLPVAAELHDKVLYADAEMNKADWLTAGAAALGILGIGIGIWWADAVAALVISLDILHDGVKNVGRATKDLMDERATKYDSAQVHPLLEVLRGRLLNLDWVDDAAVRAREQGHVFQVEAFVVPRGADAIAITQVEEAQQALLDVDWKIHDVVVAPVRDLPRLP